MSETTKKNPAWKSDSTHQDLSERLREGLHDVVDPEIGMSVIELGMIRDVIIKENRAHIEMILTTPFCPYAPALLESARKKSEEILELETTISMGSEMWDMSMMEDGADGNWGLW